MEDMKKIYIVHGWDGSPQNDWIGWATKELRALGHAVTTPSMPHPERPEIKEWVDHLRSVATPPRSRNYFYRS